MYRTKEGKTLEAYGISEKRYEQMEKNGYCWRSVSCHETDQEAYDRLAKEFKTVRIYSQGTRIRGYRSLYAMVKR